MAELDEMMEEEGYEASNVLAILEAKKRHLDTSQEIMDSVADLHEREDLDMMNNKDIVE